MRYSDDERALIWMDSFLGLTKEQKLNIIRCAVSPSAILKDLTLLKDYFGINLDEHTYESLKASLEIGGDRQVIADLEQMGIVALTCMSDGYPEKLLNIPDPPLILYCKGNLNLLNAKSIFTIVGSRKTLPAILAKAEEFSKELSENGVVIATGLAEGVDVSAIKGAIATGNVISILPGGFRHVYPEFHTNIFNQISENGLVVSEHNPEVVSRPYHFIGRNRLLAGIADGVLIASAGKKSGTYYTADFANSYGRDVFAFPYTIGTPSGEGCNAMIKEFAMLCDSVEDIFTALCVSKKKVNKQITLTDNEIRVFNCIKDGEKHIDLIMEQTNLPFMELSPVLTLLEIKKFIVKNPGNTYSAIK